MPTPIHIFSTFYIIKKISIFKSVNAVLCKNVMLITFAGSCLFNAYSYFISNCLQRFAPFKQFSWLNAEVVLARLLFFFFWRRLITLSEKH